MVTKYSQTTLLSQGDGERSEPLLEEEQTRKSGRKRTTEEAEERKDNGEGNARMSYFIEKLLHTIEQQVRIGVSGGSVKSHLNT